MFFIFVSLAVLIFSFELWVTFLQEEFQNNKENNTPDRQLVLIYLNRTE